jgi:hypothetical protein
MENSISSTILTAETDWIQGYLAKETAAAEVRLRPLLRSGHGMLWPRDFCERMFPWRLDQ